MVVRWAIITHKIGKAGSGVQIMRELGFRVDEGRG